jgi:hypothetical protein
VPPNNPSIHAFEAKPGERKAPSTMIHSHESGKCSGLLQREVSRNVVPPKLTRGESGNLRTEVIPRIPFATDTAPVRSKDVVLGEAAVLEEQARRRTGVATRDRCRDAA